MDNESNKAIPNWLTELHKETIFSFLVLLLEAKEENNQKCLD